MELNRRLAEVEASLDTGASVERLSELTALALAEAKISDALRNPECSKEFENMKNALAVLRDSKQEYYYAAKFMVRSKHPEWSGYVQETPENLKRYQAILDLHDFALKTMAESPKRVRQLTASLYSQMR